ncbi:MAG: ArsC family reductase [Opitutaceae bacterium]|nr:ArsC family reductase [Cytophagales bacterium]
MIKIYGIKNCDTMKKAFNWLDSKGVKYSFHDYKKAGIDEETIRKWLTKLNLEQIINVKGTTWKQLSDEQKALVKNANTAIALMMEKPSLIKRPLADLEGEYVLGFIPEVWEKTF